MNFRVRIRTSAMYSNLEALFPKGLIQKNQFEGLQRLKNKLPDLLQLQNAIQAIQRAQPTELPTHTFGSRRDFRYHFADNALGTGEWTAMTESPTNPTPKQQRLRYGKTAFFSHVKGNLFWD